MATKISGMTAVTGANLDDTALLEVTDKNTATRKATVAQLRTQLYVGAASATTFIIGGAAAGPVALQFNVATGTNRLLQSLTAGVERWRLTLGNNTAESGANVGSDFSLGAFSDVGVLLANVLTITRANSAIVMAGAVTIGGALAGVTTVAATGSVTLGGNAVASAVSVTINTAAGQQRLVNIQSGGSLRWAFGGQSDAEGGSDAGSSFVIIARTDAGGAIDTPVTITRAAGGSLTISRPIVGSSSLKVATGFCCNGVATPQTAVASGGALAGYVTGAFGLDSNAHMLAMFNLVVAMRAALVANGIMS